MGKLSRTKGHSFERRIAVEFQELGWEDAMTARAARGGDWSTTDHGIDIVGAGPFAVQCKRFKGYAPISCVEEILINSRDDIQPFEDYTVRLLITKADHKPTMAVLPWDELKKLIKMAYSAQR